MTPMPPTNPCFAAAAPPHHAGASPAAGTAWSASPDANNTDNAWNVNFNNGNDNWDNKNNANRVRLVRSGEWTSLAPACALGFHGLYVAWQSARQRKRPSHNQLAFESSWLDGLAALQERVNTGAWWPSPPVCFVTTRPKAREIHAPDFADRVLHHWLVPRLEPLFEPVFVHDSFSNRQGKGTHAAVQRLQQHMRRLRDGAGRGQAHYLQLDIHNFFNSIHRPTLYGLLKHTITRRCKAPALAHTLCWLCHRLLARPPAQRVQWRASPQERAQVPPHKRLAEAAPGCGLPIGNLTSQFFANVYLHELDEFIKRTLKCRHYVRYVDDFVLLHADPAQLRQWQAHITAFLAERLQLRLKPDIKTGHVDDGVDFLGYVVHPKHLTVRPRVLRHVHERLQQWQAQPNVAQLRATVASYWGHLAHARAHKARRRWVLAFPWLTLWFAHPEQPNPGWRSPPKAPRSLADQLAWLRQQFPHATVRVQQGLGRVVLPGRSNHVVWVREAGRLATGLRERVVAGGRRAAARTGSPSYSIFARRTSP